MKTLVLKVDVDTLRGTLEGVPGLVRLFKANNVNATFLFSLGPDHTGRAIKRVFRPGFMKKVSRTSVLEHYGVKTLLYGTLLPGPDIGKPTGRGAEVMRQVQTAGFEVGIHCWDHIRWQDGVAHANAAWTKTEFDQAYARFSEIFGATAATHGAAGWQMNTTAYQLEAAHGMQYASDTRGQHPFLPVADGQLIPCVQMPTTLPTLDELLGVDDITADNIHEHLLAQTRADTAYGHVFTLHAELEGMKLLPALQRLIQGWQAQGYTLISMAEYFSQLNPATLPKHAVFMGEIPGRSGVLALQGKAV